MTRIGRIAFGLISLALAAGVVYYWAPWQPAGQQTAANKQGKGKNKRGLANAPSGEAVPVLAGQAKVAHVPVFLHGGGTAPPPQPPPGRPQVARHVYS